MTNTIVNLDRLIDIAVSNSINASIANDAIVQSTIKADEAAASATLAESYKLAAELAAVTAVAQVPLAQAEVANATAQAVLAQGYASDAQGYADIAGDHTFDAGVYAANALGSKLAAEIYATSAVAARNQAENYRDDALFYSGRTADIYDHFDDRYLGSKASDPLTDNDGQPLMDGALYWNSTLVGIYVYHKNAGSWRELASAAGGLLISQNLADLPDKDAARTNLDVYSKAEISTIMQSQNEADEILYDGTTSGLVATHVQGAIDEVEARVQAMETTPLNPFNQPLNTTDSVQFAGLSVPDNTLSISDTNGLQGALDAKQSLSEKGVANGYASLDAGGKVPSSELPSYVDDVLEYPSYGTLPGTGETGKIYIVVTDETSGGNTSSYRWTGTVYAMVSNTLDSADVKSLYEANADTNAYTDAEKTKVGYISVATNTDLDAMKAEDVEIVDRFVDMHVPNGFNRQMPTSMGIMELCAVAAGGIVHRIDQNGVYTKLTGQTLFGDGSILEDRTIVHYPFGGGTIDVWVAGTKYEFSAAQKRQFAAVSGISYAYYTAAGLQVGSTFDPANFETMATVSTVYGNAGTGEKVVFSDERHGITMDGSTHKYLHFTQGTKYISGFGLNGLAASGTTFASIAAGVAYDEDIVISTGVQTVSPFWYIDGTVWRGVLDGNNLGYIESGDTYVSYNKLNGGVWSLEEVTTNDFICMHFILTNDKEYPVVRVLGQQLYGNVGQARTGIENEVRSLVLAGLPSLEVLFIGSVILSRNGQLQLLADGSAYLDLRKTSVSGSGGVSGTTTYAVDVVYDNSVSGLPGTNVQTALDGITASVISVTPQGNLSSNTVQLALEELQNQIDEIVNPLVEW
jgi:hypothetical protein